MPVLWLEFNRERICAVGNTGKLGNAGTNTVNGRVTMEFAS